VSDIPAIVSFIVAEAVEAEGRTVDQATVERAIQATFDVPGRVRYWILTDSSTGDVIGSAGVMEEWSDWYAAPYWWLHSIFLRESARGRGLVKLLIDHVEAEARKAGAIEFRLYVYKDNERAARAYHKLGFADAPYRIMAKRLS